MKADNRCQRARSKPNRGLVLILSLVSMTLTRPVWAQQGAPTVRQWQEPVPVDWPNDAAEMSAGAPVIAAKLPFRLFEEKKPSGDPFIDAGADAQWQLAEAIAPQKSSSNKQAPGSKQAKSTQPYPWPQPIDSVINYGNTVPAEAATEAAAVAAETAEVAVQNATSGRRPLAKLKLPSLGKGLRLPKLAAKKLQNAVVPQIANENVGDIPPPNGVQPPSSQTPGSHDVLQVPSAAEAKLKLTDRGNAAEVPGLRIRDTTAPNMSSPQVPTGQVDLPDTNLPSVNVELPTAGLPRVNAAQIPGSDTPNMNTTTTGQVDSPNVPVPDFSSPLIPTPNLHKPNNNDPQFNATQIPTPQIAVPQIPAPQIPAPQVGTNQLPAASVQTQLPAVKAPNLQPPALDLPHVARPQVDPNFQLPDVNTIPPRITAPQLPPKITTPEHPLPQIDATDLPSANSQLPTGQLPNLSTPQLDVPHVKTPQLILPDLESPQFPQANLPPADYVDVPRASPAGVPKAPAANAQGSGVEVPDLSVPNVNMPNIDVPNVDQGAPPIESPQYDLPSVHGPVPRIQTPQTAPPSLPDLQTPQLKVSEAEQGRASAWGGSRGDIGSFSSAAPSYSPSNEPLPNPAPPAVQALKTIPHTNLQHATTPPPNDSQLESATVATRTESDKLSSAESKPAPPLTEDHAEDRGHGNLVEASRVLALVGNQSILAGDVLGQVNELLKPYEGKAPPAELDRQRQLLVQQALPSLIDNKLVFLDFLRTIPADKLPELEERVFKLFTETELPKLIAKAEVKSSAELDAKLRELGSSLDKQRRLFMEKSIASQMVRRGVKLDKEVTHDEMLQYYYEHSDDYQVQARARWEHLMTRFDEFETRAAAWKALAEMGNEVLRGAPSQAVARRSSQGPRAKDGGVHDWTTKGSLVSDELDKALFAMPTGRWSQIITDDDGFHIVRVVEREPAGKVPFTDVQDEIREKIQRKRFNEGVAEYLAGLRESTYVWTAFEGELNGARAQVANPLTPPQSTLR